MQSRSNNNLRGIDISNHQQDVDLSQVKSSGVQVVYCKATESDFYKDPYTLQNYQNAKANGLKIGFYHFFRGDTDAKVQANFFINYLKEIGAMDFDCKLCLDIESTEGVGATELTTMCIEFLEEIKRLTGKEVVVYTYTSFANDNLDSRLAIYPLWIAHYGVETPGDNPIWNSWVGFQYSSEGSVPGVNGNCDVNEFNSDILLSRLDSILVENQSNPCSQGKILKIKYANEWSVYPLGVATVKSNACGSLNPRDFGDNGILQYSILDTPMANTVTIQTRDYGKVNIYIPHGDSEWEIVSAVAEIYVNLKDFKTSWRVYNLDAPVEKGYERGFLNPSLGSNGGLSYKVIESFGRDVYSINTDSFDTVKIYCPTDNEGSISNIPLYELV